jgi:Fe-S-cluster-containing hydrogenase component 2
MGLQSKHLKLDPELCTGCGICELICSFTKFKVFNPRFSLVKIRYDYEVGRVEGAVLCSQCGECSKVCPTGALHLDNGIIYLDHSRCSLCQTCVDSCPADAIVVVNGAPYKCDLCGGSPLCVRYCVRGALHVS